jgi:DNA repair ATPase RecN
MAKTKDEVLLAIEQATEEITKAQSLNTKGYKALDFALDETDKFVFITLYDHVRTSVNAWADELKKMENNFEKATEQYNQISAVLDALQGETKKDIREFTKRLERDKSAIEDYFGKYQENHQPLHARVEQAQAFQQAFLDGLTVDENNVTHLDDNVKYLLLYFKSLGSIPNTEEA